MTNFCIPWFPTAPCIYRTLNDNALSGTVPKSLAALANTLTEVNVANNNFNGVASELKALKKLKVL